MSCVRKKDSMLSENKKVELTCDQLMVKHTHIFITILRPEDRGCEVAKLEGCVDMTRRETDI